MTNPKKPPKNHPKPASKTGPADLEISGLSHVSLTPTDGSREPIRLSDALQTVADGLIDHPDHGEPVSAMQYLSEMLWSFVITGRAKYLNGQEVRVPNNDQWLKIAQNLEVDVIGISRATIWNECAKPIAWDPMVTGEKTAAEVLPELDACVQALLDDINS